ncbi:hypothetical protein Tco_0316305 [Tanacetum coccineum]
MACLLPHTDSGVEALVERLINKDKGRQDVLLNLAFQFEDSCAVRDDLRKAYEKCNDISQESCSSSQTNCPLAEKDLHQLLIDEEALKEMVEEEAMNKKTQEEKIRQEQAENDAFFLEFGVVSCGLMGEMGSRGCETSRGEVNVFLDVRIVELSTFDVLQMFGFFLQMGFTLILATLDGLDVCLLGDVIGEDDCDEGE